MSKTTQMSPVHHVLYFRMQMLEAGDDRPLAKLLRWKPIPSQELGDFNLTYKHPHNTSLNVLMPVSCLYWNTP